MVVGASGDNAIRRWRLALTAFAWLLIVRSGLSLFSGFLLIPLATLLIGGGVAAQFRPLAAAGVGHALVVGVGSVGLLRRRRWGWYVVVISQILEVGAAFAFAIPALKPVLMLLDPGRATVASFAIAGLVALVPASIAGFLMLEPVVAQFEQGRPRSLDQP
ncbi:MAG: hypothetical protein ABIL25_00485 [candidate division WOR-3 bacterium]